MKLWQCYEVAVFDAIKRRYETKDITFELVGGNDSTMSDIEVYSGDELKFFIEIKMPVCQSGQFVVLDEDGMFRYSERNRYPENECTKNILEFINKNHSAVASSGTAGYDIDVKKDISSRWIKEHYKEYKAEYIATINEFNELIIIPMAKIHRYYKISAKCRAKRSGSRNLPIKEMKNFEKLADSRYGKVELERREGHCFISSRANNIKAQDKLITPDSTYYISEKEDNLVVKKLARTNNMTVIFSMKLKRSQKLIDKINFEKRLKLIA